MQIILPKPGAPSFQRKFSPAPSATIAKLPGGAAAANDGVILAESDAAELEAVLGFLAEPSLSSSQYAAEGLYFAGHRPDCIIVGLARSPLNRTSQQIRITTVGNIVEMRKLIRDNKEPYGLFVIDALPYDALAGVEAIVQEITANKGYFNHQPVVSAVEKNAPGLVSELAERYAHTPLRFIEARKYGRDVIDAQLFAQLR